MLVFGVIVVVAFVGRLRGRNAATFPSLMIAIGFLGIGAWALVASNFAGFFWLFIVIGLLLLIGAWPSSNSFGVGRGDAESSDYIH